MPRVLNLISRRLLSTAVAGVALAAFDLSAATVTTRVDNTGGTILIGGEGLSVASGGEIVGGTIDASAFPLYVADGALHGVTLIGQAYLRNPHLRNGLTLVPDASGRPISIEYGTYVLFDGPAQTIGGKGTLRLFGPARFATTPGAPVTLGPDVTLHLTPHHGSDALRVGAPGRTIINQGTLHFPAAWNQTVIDSSGDGAFVNQGLLRLDYDANVIIDTGPGWSNTGLIRHGGQSLAFRGNVSPNAIGAVERIYGGLYYEGAYNNTGQTISTEKFGPLILFNSTIRGGRIEATEGRAVSTQARAYYAGDRWGPNTFDGVTLAGPMYVRDGPLRIENGITLDGGTLAIGASSGALLFDTPGEHHIAGHGVVEFLPDYSSFGGRAVHVTAGALTIDAGVTVRSRRSVTLDAQGHAVVNRGTFVAADERSSTLVYAFAFDNHGAITADGQGRSVSIYSSRFTNHGTIQASNGANVTIGGGGLDWSSPGRILLDGGTLTVNATDTTSNLVGRLSKLTIDARNSGALVLGGVIDNTDATLDLDDRPAPLLFSGTIRNGAVAGGTSRVPLRAKRLTLEHVSVGTDLHVQNAATVTLTNGTSLHGDVLLASTGSATRLIADQPLEIRSGTEVVYDGRSQYPYGVGSLHTTPGHTLTIAPAATVRTGTGSGGLGHKDSPLLIRGVVSAGTPGQYLKLAGSSVTNEGLLRVGENGSLSVVNLTGNANRLEIAPRGDLQLDGDYVLDRPLSVPSGARLTLNGTWRNTGGIRVDGGTFGIQQVPDDPGPLTFQNAAVSYSGLRTTTSELLKLPPATIVVEGGSVDNRGQTIHLTAERPWRLYAGAISGGTISADPGQRLLADLGQNFLDDVRLSADLDVLGGYADFALSVATRLTLDHSTVTLRGDATSPDFYPVPSIWFEGDGTTEQPLDGDGRIVFGGSGRGAIQVWSPLAIGAGVTIQTGTSDGSIHGRYPVTNHGTLLADGTGRSLALSGKLTNHGKIAARNGATIHVRPGLDLFSTGTISTDRLVNDGTLTHAGSSADLGDVTSSVSGGILRVAAGRDLFARTLQRQTLVLEENATVRLSPKRSPTDHSRLNDLQLAAGATLDLADQPMILPLPSASPAAALARLDELESLLHSARNADTDAPWSGPGLTSALLLHDTPHHTLALLDNLDPAGHPFPLDFLGQPHTTPTGFVLYTWTGDTDFDGLITSADYDRFERGLTEGLTGYRHGDFNYDGSIDAKDRALIDAAFEAQHVPEPFVIPLSLLLCGLQARRRRPRKLA